MAFTDFLQDETAGLPNWAWGLVVVAGLGIAVIVPKFFGKSGSTNDTATDNGSSNASGIGLAVDPTTGLPYAVEGLVPSGATAGGTSPATTTTAAAQKLEAMTRKASNTEYTTSHGGNPNLGVPVFGTPDENGTLIGREALSSPIEILGAAVKGSSNIKGAGAKYGSTTWYPVSVNGQRGYISAYDLDGTPEMRPVGWPNT